MPHWEVDETSACNASNPAWSQSAFVVFPSTCMGNQPVFMGRIHLQEVAVAWRKAQNLRPQ